MKVALVNPAWRFDGSIYFGCREPHLPLELGYARALMQADGAECLLLDGDLMGMGNKALATRVAAFAPDMTIVTTAPSYLFWRCAQPELTVPREFLDLLGGRGGTTIAIGPHGSSTPRAALRKLGCDIVARGEAEELLARLTRGDEPQAIPGLCFRQDGDIVVTGAPHVGRFTDLAPLRWEPALIDGHAHHHHRCGDTGAGLGAEVEASRGCPFACTFCAKLDFRDGFRRRALPALLAEIDGLISQGVRYLYFIDEIFLPDEALLDALAARDVRFGVQTRLDVWRPEMIDLLAHAGCVSIEAGVESVTREGRNALAKKCRAENDDLIEKFARARRGVPFVQANLIACGDDPAEVDAIRARFSAAGVWTNDPVPLFPYPGSPDYRARWGLPDDDAWERAHAHYLASVSRFCDLQSERPLPLPALEKACACA